MKHVVTALLIVALAGVGYALFAETGENMTYYYEADQVAGADVGDDRIKISGIVAKDSIQRHAGTLQVNFVVEGANARIPIEYVGVVPDIFREGIQVVVAGSFSKGDGVFYADDLLAKCPSKYQAKGSKDDFQHLDGYEIEYDHRQSQPAAASSSATMDSPAGE